MFVVVAGTVPEEPPPSTSLSAMAGALRGGNGVRRAWCDPLQRAALAADCAGLLPEDRFDRQPYVDDRVAFVCHARLDNRAELLAALGMAADDGRALADADLFFRAYQRWGDACVQRLVGDYAFAAWHRDSGRIVAGLDPLAAASLYYAEWEGRLALSPQLAAVLAHPRLPRTLDLEALALMPAPKSLDGATPWAAVRAVPGGHLLVAEGGVTRLTRWWTPDCAPRVWYRDPRDYVAHATTLFRDAVAAQLRTTGRVAATLSGGLDSTLVAATAATLLRERGERLATFTAVPEPGLACREAPHWDASDREFAAAVAARHDNIDAHFVTTGNRPPLDVFPALHARSCRPVRNSANHLWLAEAARAARAGGARVILLGERGNASISAAGGAAVGELARRGRWRTAARVARSLNAGEGIPLWRLAASAALVRRRYVPVPGRHPGAALLTDAWRARVRARLTDVFAGMTQHAKAIAFLTRPRLAWTADPLVQWGVEWRDPTADRRLVECLLSFSPEAFVVGGRYRGLARSMGEGLVPDLVRMRRTRGAQVPEHASLVAAHAARYLHAIDAVSRSTTCRAMFDLTRMRRIVEQWPAAPDASPDPSTLDRVLDVALFVAAHETSA